MRKQHEQVRHKKYIFKWHEKGIQYTIPSEKRNKNPQQYDCTLTRWLKLKRLTNVRKDNN